MTTNDLHWAAGFLDGEGCFGFTKYKDKARPTHIYRRFFVAVTQRDKELMSKLKKLFGGSVFKTCEGYWRWSIFGPRARGIMMTLFVLLSHRQRERVKKALKNDWVLPGQRLRKNRK